MRAKRTGRFPVLSLGDVELGVPDPISDRALVTKREACNVMAGILDGYAAPRLADHDDDLALIVELFAFGWTDQVLEVAGEGFRESQEDGRVAGVRLVGIFGGAAAVVDADAENFCRVGEESFVGDVGQRMVCGFRCECRRIAETFGPDECPQVGNAKAVLQIDDPVAIR